MKHVYLRAAQRIAMKPDDYLTNNRKTKGCCDALGCATPQERGAFADLFYRRNDYWWTWPAVDRPATWRDQNARVLALLFMHWITQPEAPKRPRRSVGFAGSITRP